MQIQHEKGLKKNIIANVLGKLWGMVSIFIFIPLYIKILGLESYGLISFFSVLQASIYLLGAGLSTTLRREFALGERNKENDIKKYKLMKSIEFVYFIMGFITIFSSFFLSDLISQRWLKITSLNHETIRITIILMCISIVLQMITELYNGGLLGLEKQVTVNKNQFIWSICKNVLVLVVLKFIKSDVIGFYSWFIFCDFLYLIVTRYTIKNNIMAEKELKWILADLKNLGLIWKFTMGIFAISIIQVLNTQLDKVLLSKLLNIEELGIYNLAYLLSQIPLIIVSAISVTFFSRFSFYYSIGKFEDLIVLFKKTYRVVLILSVTIGITMSMYSKELLFIWTRNQDITNKSHLVVSIIVIGSMFLSIQVIPYNLALAFGNTKINNILGIVSLALVIPSLIVLVKKFGVLGAAINWMYIMTLTTFIYNYFIYKKFVHKENVLKWIFSDTLVPLGVIGLFSLLIFIFVKTLELGYTKTLLLGIIQGSLVLSLAYFVFNRSFFILVLKKINLKLMSFWRSKS